MNNLNDHKKRTSTFKSELLKLKQLNYINEDTFNTIKQAYHEYDHDYSNELSNNMSMQKTKAIASPEQIRERNISIIMITGVILLLLGGLILSTSTWNIISSLMKTMLIFMVCFLFYGISIVSEKVLKIHKTSYAFLSLSALFLPISILSAGYFELFGPWLSFYGRGKYTLGILGSIICTVLYAATAFKANYKLFMWFTMVANTATMMFIALQIKNTKEIFFLGMILYCSLLILLYDKIKNNSKLNLLAKELIKYITIVTSFFTVLLFIFSSNKYLLILISYMLLFINMTYVSYSIKSKILSCSASLLLIMAEYYSYLLINKLYFLRDSSNIFGTYMFIMSAITFFFLYYKNNYKYTIHLKTSTMATSLIMMYICMASAWITNSHIRLGLEAIILNLLLLILLKTMKEELEIKTFLYLILFNITPIMSSLVSFNTHTTIPLENIMVLTSYIIFILWIFSKPIWKNRISYYFIVFGICSLYGFNLIYPFTTADLLEAVVLSITILYVLHKKNLYMLNLIPLLSLIYTINTFTHRLTIQNHKIITILILAALFIIFKFTGEILSKDLYIMKKREFTFIDFYFPAALLICPIMWKNLHTMSLIYRLIPGLLLIYLLSSQIKRVSDNLIKNIVISLSIIASLIPYYLIIGEYIEHKSFYYCIASYVPLVLLAELIIDTPWKNNKKTAYNFQWLILTLVFFRLLIAVNSTYTAIILGILSVLSIIAGMQYRIKCYFFIGIGALAFNILIQTKPLWGSLPWWAYLIISGFILIGLASFNEWQKKNEKKFLKDKLDKFKDWL